jgi:hypothetical protein
MKGRLTLLRLLVLVGCLPLVTRQARVVRAGPYDKTCIQYRWRPDYTASKLRFPLQRRDLHHV